MKRQDFIKIIKIRSFWKIDRRKGNYCLPNGEKLSSYVRKLVEGQMQLDKVAITEEGDIRPCAAGTWDKDLKAFSDYRFFGSASDCSYDEMQKRVNALVSEIVG